MPADAFDHIDGLTLTETLTTAMEADGIARPTPVQSEGIGAVLAGRHVLMHAGTGTGKTLAYLLPVLQRLRESEGRAVIFAPGAELVMQTFRVANAYKDADLTTAAAIATSSRRRQRKRVQRSTRLILGTPDRLIPLFKEGKLKDVRIVVLDEIEPILGARDAEFLYQLLSRSEPKVQIIVATATLGKRSEAFFERFMADGVRVQPADTPVREAISHHVVEVPSGKGKDRALVKFIRKNRCERAIVFASDPRQLSYLYHFLGEQKLKVVTLNRERSKEERRRGLAAFRNGKVQLLLTTDAAARGIDVPGVQWVLHYDLPRAAQAYVHRAGRTGRAGQQGCSVVFADHATERALRRLAKELRLTFSPFGGSADTVGDNG